MQADNPQSEAQPGSASPRPLPNDVRGLLDELAERDERFAVLEEELWAAFEAHEARHRQLLEEREQQLALLRTQVGEVQRLQAAVHERDVTIAQLTETTFRQSVRLQRIQESLPARVYSALIQLP